MSKIFHRCFTTKGDKSMKKISCLVAVFMLFLSSWAYAGGGQNCGDNATGPAGTEAQGDATQNRAPNP